MLIQFSVKNFRSFRDRQTLSLMRAKGGELMASNTFDAPGGVSLLKSAVMYGPNAGGKTNFLLAMRAMQKTILKSATESQSGDSLPVTPFRLSQASRKKPCEFEAIFIADRVRYQYGFAATEDRIVEEWLLAFPKGRPQHWLSRRWNTTDNKHEWQIGNSLTGAKQLWRNSTRDNALFLSTAVQLNSEQLRPIYTWFRETLRMAGIGGWSPRFSALLCEKDRSMKSHIIDYLRAADMAVADIDVERKQFDDVELPDDVSDQKTEEINGQTFVRITTARVDAEGGAVHFDFSDESHGTRKVFALSGPWIDCLDKGYIVFIDELNVSLHPYLTRFLVQLFNSSAYNPNNAQLIFTTHETSILTQDLFRRDQIWFCEKENDHASKMIPLTDYSPRKGRENLEQAYLSGRYSAVPYITPLHKVS